MLHMLWLSHGELQEQSESHSISALIAQTATANYRQTRAGKWKVNSTAVQK